MIFGIDYDGTFSRDPDAFRQIVHLLRLRGHVCVCVTGRSDEGRWGAEVKRGIAGLMPIVFTAGAWKALAAERAGYKVDVWIDDMPEGIRELRADFAAFKREQSEAPAATANGETERIRLLVSTALDLLPQRSAEEDVENATLALKAAMAPAATCCRFHGTGGHPLDRCGFDPASKVYGTKREGASR